MSSQNNPAPGQARDQHPGEPAVTTQPPSGHRGKPVDLNVEMPTLPDPPQRHEQDTEIVAGEEVLNPPPDDDLIQRGKIQG